MGRQVIHEEADLCRAIQVPQLFEVFYELLRGHGLLEDLEVLLPTFLGYAGQQRQRGLVQHLDFYGKILLGQGPLRVLDGLPGEACLVEVDDPVIVSLGHGQLPLHCC